MFLNIMYMELCICCDMFLLFNIQYVRSMLTCVAVIHLFFHNLFIQFILDEHLSGFKYFAIIDNVV